MIKFCALRGTIGVVQHGHVFAIPAWVTVLRKNIKCIIMHLKHQKIYPNTSYKELSP